MSSPSTLGAHAARSLRKRGGSANATHLARRPAGGRLVRALCSLRRILRAGYGFAIVATLAVALCAGWFALEPGEGLHWGLWLGRWALVIPLVARLLWWAVAHRRGAPRARSAEPKRAFCWRQLEVSLLLWVATHIVVQAGGGFASPLHPLLFVLIAWATACSAPGTGAALLGAALLLDAAVAFWVEPGLSLPGFGLHAAYLLSFGALSAGFTRTEVARVREAARQELDREQDQIREQARLFRLSGAPSSRADADAPAKRVRASVEHVHEALTHLLDLVRQSLSLYTCALCLRDERSGALSIAGLASGAPDVSEGPFPPNEGAVGAVATRGVAMNLENLKLGYRGLCYYREPAVVRSFLGVPVRESGRVRGVLCADRLDPRPFSKAEALLLTRTAEQVVRALENERIFASLEQSKREQAHLYRASQALGEAVTEDQVVEAGLAAAADIAPYDFAAMTTYDAPQKRHCVSHAAGVAAEALRDLSFRDNTSLVAMAVRNRHYLPYRGDYDPQQQVVFTRRAQLPDMRSLLVLPLSVREDAIGTLVLGSRSKGAFGEAVRTTLQVLANQLAVAMSNAGAVARLEALATTDGLTGCLNKRSFLEELDAKWRSAARFSRKLSLLVTDLDHFKAVNDTYGHATGDVVIQGLGTILNRVKRETDSVARFGGEEFCVLCEETDTEGAISLAERVRSELSATRFQSESGPVRITCSIGVATFPQDARTPEQLFEVSDQALYAAKRRGRDRVCTARDIPSR